MKKTTVDNLKIGGFALFVVCIIALVLMSAGCGTVKGLAVKETVVEVAPARTNWVQIVSTNTLAETNVIEVVVTNAAWEVVAALQPRVVLTTQIVTNAVAMVTPAVVYTNVALANGAGSAVQAAGRVASNLGVPFADVASGLLVGLAGAVFGFINQRRARKAREAASAEAVEHDKTRDALGVAQDAATALVQNFEQLRVAALEIPAYRQIDGKVMKAVTLAQSAMGVKPIIEKLVEEHTDYTRAAAPASPAQS